jgi:SAM-dependent methyltransferase
MAKLTRMPLFGFAIEWALALAGLPLLLRHQRAADTSVAARFNATADAQREHGTRIQSLEQAVASAHAGLAALSAEHDRRSEALRADIRHAAMRLDDLERRAAALEQRVETGAHAQLELRHYVHAANHWIASLQGSLAGLEDFAEQQRERADRLTAAIGESAQQTAARNARHATWSAELAQRLRADASVLDLGSGDGAWLVALRAQGIAANGIESNQTLVARAQAHLGQLAAGDPLAALERCADASLGGLSVAASLLATAPVMAELLGQALRVLAADGWLLLRIEPESYRFGEGSSARDIDLQTWIAVLEAAGFAPIVRLDADGAGALLAHRR